MSLKEKLVSFFHQCVRVWHVLRKPTSQEFKNVSKVAAIGILLLGAIGFVISVLLNIFK